MYFYCLANYNATQIQQETSIPGWHFKHELKQKISEKNPVWRRQCCFVRTILLAMRLSVWWFQFVKWNLKLYCVHPIHQTWPFRISAFFQTSKSVMLERNINAIPKSSLRWTPILQTCTKAPTKKKLRIFSVLTINEFTNSFKVLFNQTLLV